MRTARALVAMVALAAVIGWSSAATAITFDIDVNVGWINATGTCSGGPGNCLGFAGTGGFGAGSSTRLNWDNATGTVGGGDSFLGIGALPQQPASNFPANSPANIGSIPVGAATGTISDNNSPIQTAGIRHTNNAINADDNDLATIQLNTQLVLRSGATTILDLPFNPIVRFLETFNEADVNDCNQTSNSLGSACDDQFTFSENVGTLNVPFSFGGDDFILHIRGLVNADGSFACEAGGGTTLNCLTEEGQVNDRFVTAAIEKLTREVPAPAGLLLLGMGLVGMVIRKRLSA